MHDVLKYYERVEYKEPFSIRVGRFLLSKGFYPAESSGRALLSLKDSASISVLYEDPKAKPKKFLFFTTNHARQIFLGTIHFLDPNSYRQEWAFNVHGSENVELAKQLAEELSLEFSARIIVRLVSERL